MPVTELPLEEVTDPVVLGREINVLVCVPDLRTVQLLVDGTGADELDRVTDDMAEELLCFLEVQLLVDRTGADELDRVTGDMAEDETLADEGTAAELLEFLAVQLFEGRPDGAAM